MSKQSVDRKLQKTLDKFAKDKQNELISLLSRDLYINNFSIEDLRDIKSNTTKQKIIDWMWKEINDFLIEDLFSELSYQMTMNFPTEEVLGIDIDID